MATATADKRHAPGEISADSLYSLSEIKARLGLGVAAMRTARRRGLQVRMIGRKGFVLGEDVIRYVREGEGSAK